MNFVKYKKYGRKSFFINKKIVFLLILMFFIIGGGVYSYFEYKKHNFPIDLVYLWVDGRDEKWVEKKVYWQKKLGIIDPYAVHPARWRDREELKHSLRSVEQHMPWVNKIYIVTDNQVPEWLNTNHPKIKIIDHKEILPADALPVFNSMAIETGIANIKGLSEHFIYANDDVFAAKPLTREFFFTKDGTPIVYNDIKLAKRYQIFYKKSQEKGTMWAKLHDKEKKVLSDKSIGINIEFADTHTFSSYKKSTYLKAMEFFGEEMKKTAHSKFRSGDDLNRGVVLNYAWKYDSVLLKSVTDVKEFGCKNAGILIMTNVKDLEKKDPCTFCLNDYQNIPDDINEQHTLILRKMFPDKSSFEK